MFCSRRHGVWKRRLTRSQHAGFSLVELMVVIVIIGLLAGAVTVGVRSYLIKGRRGAAKLHIARIDEALQNYYIAKGRYPTSQEGLQILKEPLDDLSEPPLTTTLLDPWGNTYEYSNPGPDREPYVITTYGADGQEGGQGGDADITNINVREGT